MKKNGMNELISKLSSLPEKEKADIVARIMDMMSSSETGNEKNCSSLVRDNTFMSGKPDCPHCKAQANLGYIVKKGFKGTTQRYYCKSCGRTFVASTNTAFEGTHKTADVWEKFIHMTISGDSIKKCVEECHIACQTAFTWRHKVLNVFRVHQESVKMSGKVEMDEMLIPISYKGNHISGNFGDSRRRGLGVDNNLPRKSFKRGSDNKSSSSKDKACVFCMIKNGSEAFYASVPGVGFMLPSMLDETFAKHVDKESSLVLVDQYKVTKNYLESNNYKYMILASNTSDNPHDHKPEIQDDKHLQHINAMHHHLRKFLAKYCGVSSKYLANYVALYTWLKNVTANKQSKNLNKISLSRASNSDCYISQKDLKAYPAVPVCA